MSKKQDISVELNYPKDEEQLKELQNKKAKIMIDILEHKYGEIVLEKYINSIRENNIC